MRFILIALLLSLVIAEAASHLSHRPAVVALLAGLLLFSLAAWRASGSGRVIAVNLAFGCLLLLGVELRYDSGSAGPPRKLERFGDYTAGYIREPVAWRGYGPTPGTSADSRLVADGETIYDVTYTIDENELRITPSVEADSSILFFGGSFTFGEGLDDEETFPFRVGLHARPVIQAMNFAFHGYGPHHMVAMLESGFVTQRVHLPPKAIVFLTSWFHIDRVSGSKWDEFGPRYALDGDGRSTLMGTFDDRPRWSRVKDLMRERLLPSEIGRRLVRRLHPLRAANFDLYLALIVAARDRAAEDFPSADFHVVIWDRAESRYLEPTVSTLREAGMSVHQLSESIADFREEPERFILHDADKHPSPFATDRVARVVATEILGGSYAVP